MRKRHLLLFAVLLLPMVLAACSTPEPAPTPTPGPFTLTVLYTNDGWGYTEPCACDPPVGGFARRAAYIDQVREQAEHVLVVDAGDSLLSLYHLGDLEQGRLLAEAFDQMGYDAIALGGMDFRMGLDVLREQIEVADYPVLSANTLDPQTGEAFDEPYVIHEIGQHRVALIGLTDAKTTLEVTEGKVQVMEPVDTLMRTIERIEDRADIIIVLSHLGFMFDANLSQVVSGIDLIVSGLDGEVYDPPLTAAGPVIVSAGNRGEYIGRVDLEFDAAGNVVSVDAKMQILSDEIQEDPEMRQWMAQSGMIEASALKSGQPGQFTQ